MINDKKSYRFYLNEDKKALGAKTKHPLISKNCMVWLTDPCWKFQKLLRKLEYYENTKMNCGNFLKCFYTPYVIFLRYKFQKKSISLGLTIPINVFGYGLCINHYGSIVVSRHARIGNYCKINSACNICGNGESSVIGDYCELGPGAKIIKSVILGDNVKVGANAVVNKSFKQNNIVIAGVPAVIVKHL